MPRDLLILGTMARDVLLSVKAALGATAFGEPGVAEVLHGDVDTLPDCCDGLLYVRAGRIYKVDTLANPGQQPAPCSKGWAFDVDVSLQGCAPMENTSGRKDPLPSRQTQAAYAETHLEAGLAMALACDDAACRWKDRWNVGCVVGDWLPLGPEGRCMGGTLTMSIEVPRRFLSASQVPPIR